MAADDVKREQIVESQGDVSRGDEPAGDDQFWNGLGSNRGDDFVEFDAAQQFIKGIAGDRRVSRR